MADLADAVNGITGHSRVFLTIISARRLRCVLSVTLLASKIVEAILDGLQPAEMTLVAMMMVLPLE
jgi:hypothetical protein